MRSYRALAQVFERSETETEFGGRTVDWTPLGELWIALSSPHRRGDGTGDLRPVMTETRLAQSRSDTRVQAGQRVDCLGVEWRLVHVDQDQPKMGHMTLTLTREV